MEIGLNKKDIIWSYVGTLLSLCSNMLMLPFVIYYLDSDSLGMWYIFQSLSAITQLFDFGFSVTFARNVSYCWSGVRELKQQGVTFAEQGEPDFFLLKQVLTACRYIYLMLASLAFLLLLVAGTPYIHHVSKDILSNKSMIAWFFYIVAVFLNLYYGYFAALLRGVGAIAQMQRAMTLAKIIHIGVTVVLLACGLGLVGTGIAYLLFGLAYRIIAKNFFYRYKDIRGQLNKVKTVVTRQDVRHTVMTIWPNAWRDGMVQLANYLSNQAGTVICSLFLSLTETGIYSLGVQLCTAIVNVAACQYQANQPVLQSAYVTRNDEKLRRTMAIIVFIYILLFGLGTFGVAVVGLPLLRLIRPESVISVPMFLGIAVYQFILKFRNCYTSYFSSTNRIPYLWHFVGSSIFSLILSLVMLGVFHLGVWGFLIAQIIAQGVVNAWYWPWKAHQELGIGFFKMLRLGFEETIVKMKNKFVTKPSRG